MIAQGSPYVGYILKKAFSKVQAAVVLMTPDDEACLRKPYRKENEPVWETQPTSQPRQNVLFEAGMSMGKFPDNTILVELGELRPFSDVIGRHVIRMNDSMEKRQELALRLKSAGCAVNLNGTDWHTSGNFKIKESTKFIRRTRESSSTTELVESQKNYEGLSGGIRMLIEHGFFNIPKSVNEISEELKREGYYYSLQSVDATLRLGFIKRKILQRTKENKIWKYVIRK